MPVTLRRGDRTRMEAGTEQEPKQSQMQSMFTYMPEVSANLII